jgi:hypothetical protein
MVMKRTTMVKIKKRNIIIIIIIIIINLLKQMESY